MKWQTMETAPHDAECFFWLAPKTADEMWCDTSGRPVVSDFKPYFKQCRYKSWPATAKATHWMPLPRPPEERPRSEVMDAFMKHIHGNPELSVANVSKAMDAALAKRSAIKARNESLVTSLQEAKLRYGLSAGANELDDQPVKWGTPIVSSPQYQQEQAYENARYKQLLDDAAREGK